MVYVTNVIATEYIDFCNEYIPFFNECKEHYFKGGEDAATFWTTIGLRKELFLCIQNNKRILHLRIYHETESVIETIRILGYPTRRNLYTWIAEKKYPRPKQGKNTPVIDNPPDHPRNPPLEVKLNAIHRYYELGENIKICFRRHWV